MICPNCGKEYNDRMTCCISCGADLVPYDPASWHDDARQEDARQGDVRQTNTEPVIPDIREANETEKAGFIRVIEGHSEYPPLPAPKTAAEEIPLTVQKNTSGAEVLKNIGSLAAAIVMLALILLASASAAVRLVTDSEKISRFADKLDVMNLPAENPVTLSDSSVSISPDTTVQEAVYMMSLGTGLTKEDIRHIYESSTAEDFLASQLKGYAEFIRSGELPEKLTSEKLKEVFSENISLISSAIGKPLSQHDIDLAFAELDRTAPVLEAISPSGIESSLDGWTLTVLRLFCSLPFMLSEAAAAAGMLIILRAINRDTGKTLIWGGGAVLTGGVIVLTAAFLASAQVFLSGQDRFVRSIAKCAADVITPDMYRIGGALSVLGIVMLVWAWTLAGKGQKNDH
ncbi:MAG: zinc ribbon domain-containing protein [Oscillospiraceae bacterium]|nr:zinc ribbon domain-containing protein [Oscillospiraceae bacterium]